MSDAAKEKLRASWTPERREKHGKLQRERLLTDPEWLHRFTYNNSEPKTDEHRQHMSDASLGKPKSEEHKAAMKEAHLLRGAVIRFIRETKKCGYFEALVHLSNDKQYYYDLYRESL